jgi:acyl-CoA dehydrogenase
VPLDPLTDEQREIRELVRTIARERIAPRAAEIDASGEFPWDVVEVFRENDLFGIMYDEEYGGIGESALMTLVVIEEISKVCATSGLIIAVQELGSLGIKLAGSAEQKERFLPKLATGEWLAAYALTEPGSGSDSAAMRTTAVRDGDEYVLNGGKTFITGGLLADLVIVVARTSTDPENRRRGMSLLVVEDGMPGFTKGRVLDKLGLKAQDTVELSFTDVRVPAANLLGQEGEAFSYLGANLAQERLAIAVGSVAQSRAALDATIGYVKERTAFGTPVASFQNTKFELAAVATDIEAGQALLDRAVLEHVRGELSVPDAAKVKLFCTEMQARVVDRCLQLFGGYGYMLEYPIARLFADARVARIYGGTSEVMKVIISKSLGL